MGISGSGRGTRNARCRLVMAVPFRARPLPTAGSSPNEEQKETSIVPTFPPGLFGALIGLAGGLFVSYLSSRTGNT